MPVLVGVGVGFIVNYLLRLWHIGWLSWPIIALLWIFVIGGTAARVWIMRRGSVAGKRS